MTFVTCDLCDDNADSVSVVTGHNWFSYGGRNAFGGEVVTVKCFEDNSRVKEHLGKSSKLETTPPLAQATQTHDKHVYSTGYLLLQTQDYSTKRTHATLNI